MPKKQYNARLEPDAIENLQAIAQANGVSVAEVIEASAYWLAGNDRALADCSLAMREAIANRSGQDSIAPVPMPQTVAAAALDSEALTEAIAQAMAPVLERIEALEKSDGAIAA
ncbi:MAG: hypothetical protein ACAF42_00060 (plasmid) [Limnothrix sp. BL-A-16]|jgi:hypothetical protein